MQDKVLPMGNAPQEMKWLFDAHHQIAVLMLDGMSTDLSIDLAVFGAAFSYS